jgi:hypothetical protein
MEVVSIEDAEYLVISLDESNALWQTWNIKGFDTLEDAKQYQIEVHGNKVFSMITLKPFCIMSAVSKRKRRK